MKFIKSILSKREKGYLENKIGSMSIQVLIATVNQTDASFLKQMNLQTDAIVGNQNGINQELSLLDGDNKIKFICSKKRGAANNRNLALLKSDADICLLADDDIQYIDGYAEIIKKAYEKHPDADVIIFNRYENPVKGYIIRKDFRVHFFNYMKFGSVRISFNRKSILENNIKFDPDFGPGGKIPMGEDTIFLRDCLKKKLKIIAVPDYVLSLLNNRDSTWFNGYNKNYFLNKGKLFYRLSVRFHKLLCLQDAIRHRRSYKEIGKWYTIYGLLLKGKNS